MQVEGQTGKLEWIKKIGKDIKMPDASFCYPSALVPRGGLTAGVAVTYLMNFYLHNLFYKHNYFSVLCNVLCNDVL